MKNIAKLALLFGLCFVAGYVSAQTFNLIPPTDGHCGAYSSVSCIVKTPRGTSLMIDFNGKERHSIHVVDSGKMTTGDDNVTGTFVDSSTTAKLTLNFKRGIMVLNFNYQVDRHGFRALILTSGTVNLVTP